MSTHADRPDSTPCTLRANSHTPSCPRSLWHHRPAQRRVSPPSSRCWFRSPMTDELPIVLLHGSATGSYSWAAVRMGVVQGIDYLEPLESFRTTSLSVNFFRPVWEARLCAEAHVVR